MDRSTASLPAGAMHGRVGVTGRLLGSCPQPGPFTQRQVLAQAWPGRGLLLVAFTGGAG